MYLFIWLYRVFTVAWGIFSCGIRALSCGMWDLVPRPSLEPEPLNWEHGVLAAGSPGKSPHRFHMYSFSSTKHVHIISEPSPPSRALPPSQTETLSPLTISSPFLSSPSPLFKKGWIIFHHLCISHSFFLHSSIGGHLFPSLGYYEKCCNFLGGLVAKTLCFQCRGFRFDLWSGN